MEKKSFISKRSMKEHDSLYREQFETLNEKYVKIKDILKQVWKDLRDEKEKQQHLITEYDKLVLEVKEKDALLERMQSVSEAVIDEYSVLKVKCDLEAEAATNAIKRATKYFQENQKLKRNSQHDLNVEICDSNEPSCQETNIEENVSELDTLNKLASDLRTEVASLKIQLGKEIEKQNSLKEDFEIAKELYEQEMKEHKCMKEKHESLQILYNKQITSKHESQVLEKNVQQSTVLYKQVQGSSSEESVSFSVFDTTDCPETLVEKLDLAEQQVTNYKQQNNVLLSKVQELEFQIRKLNAEVSASESLPVPPPPPPPPLPPSSFNPLKSLITFINAGKKSSKMAKKESLENPHQKAMSEMIDAIKKGNVQLKPTPRVLPPTPEKQNESALGEMKNILSTLKRKSNACKSNNERRNFEALQSTKDSVECSAQETDENYNISADIDDELKRLLRKRSLKNLTNNALISDVVHIPTDEIIYTSVDNAVHIVSKAECHVSPLSDSVIMENQSTIDISVTENAIPSSENAMRSSDSVMPSSDNDNVMPCSDNVMPSSDNDNVMPCSDKIMANSDNVMPSSECAMPNSDNDNVMPCSDKIMANSDNVMPSSESVMPFSDNDNLMSCFNKITASSDSAMPSSECVLPKSDVIPYSDSVMPSFDSVMSSSDSLMSNSDSLMSSSDGVIPSSESVMPSSESVMPSSESVMPSSESVMPSSESVMPSSESVMPSSESVMPSSENVMPSSESVMPSSDNVMPSSDNVMPSSDNVMPSSDNEMPISDNVKPSSENEVES